MVVVVAVALLAVSVIGASLTVAGTNTAAAGDGNDSLSNATDIQQGQTITANLSTGNDVDWYAVHGTAGDALLAHLQLLNTSDQRSVSVTIYTASGKQVNKIEADLMQGPTNVAGYRPIGYHGPNATAAAVAESNTTYYVRVAETGADKANDAFSTPYRLTTTQQSLDQYDPNQNGTTATQIGVNESIFGVTAAFDPDVYAVNLTAGHTYKIAYEEGNNSYQAVILGSRSPDALNTSHNVVSDGTANYSQVVYSSDSSQDHEFTPTENGTYYFALVQYGTNTHLFGTNYTLEIEQTPSGKSKSC